MKRVLPEVLPVQVKRVQLGELFNKAMEAVEETTVAVVQHGGEKKDVDKDKDQLSKAMKKLIDSQALLGNQERILDALGRDGGISAGRKEGESLGDFMKRYAEEMSANLLPTENTRRFMQYAILVEKTEREEQEEEDDDDLVTLTQHSGPSVCPISKEPFVDPVKSDTCGHTYSKAHLLSLFVGRSMQISCPVAGCLARVQKGGWKKDTSVLIVSSQRVAPSQATQGVMELNYDDI